jgi:hypothetical protein
VLSVQKIDNKTLRIDISDLHVEGITLPPTVDLVKKHWRGWTGLTRYTFVCELDLGDGKGHYGLMVDVRDRGEKTDMSIGESGSVYDGSYVYHMPLNAYRLAVRLGKALAQIINAKNFTMMKWPKRDFEAVKRCWQRAPSL